MNFKQYILRENDNQNTYLAGSITYWCSMSDWSDFSTQIYASNLTDAVFDYLKYNSDLRGKYLQIVIKKSYTHDDVSILNSSFGDAVSFDYVVNKEHIIGVYLQRILNSSEFRQTCITVKTAEQFYNLLLKFANVFEKLINTEPNGLFDNSFISELT